MKKIYATICEDEKVILKYIHQELKNAFLAHHHQILFDCYISGGELLNASSNGKKYQILFLDIEMPGINGIELCRRLRLIHPEALIVFISNREELVFQTFEVRPFAFIRKNHFTEELPVLMRNLEQEWNLNKELTVHIHEQNSACVYSFNVNDIIYIEALSKTCRIVTSESEQFIRYRLSDFETLLEKYGFLQPHRSYLVNYRYIFCIKKDSLLLDNKTEIPLSRRRRLDIQQQFISLSQGGDCNVTAVHLD